MPELPEVETTVRGLTPVLAGQRLTHVEPRRADLRKAIPVVLRQRLTGAMVTALQKGDEVALSSGMMGKISAVDDNYLVLSVGNGVELKFQKIHVTSVLPKGTLKSVGVQSD